MRGVGKRGSVARKKMREKGMRVDWERMKRYGAVFSVFPKIGSPRDLVQSAFQASQRVNVRYDLDFGNSARCPFDEEKKK